VNRLTFPTPETYTPEQARVVEIAMTRGRGRIVGPLPALLTSPVVAEHLHLVGNYLGHNSTVPRDCVEIAILVTAKSRGSDYAWGAHLPRAHEHGVSEAVTSALAAGIEPEFTDAKQALAYRVTVSLCQHTALSNTLYTEAAEAFGDQGLVELVTLVGFYHSVSMTLNVFGSPAAKPKEI
jgi:4-carboxymuconolactone decarboxylase